MCRDVEEIKDQCLLEEKLCGLGSCILLRGMSVQIEMAGRKDGCDYSTDSVRSPTKPVLSSAARGVESVHTSYVKGACDVEKGEYERARDKRVAEIQEMFKPVQEAARAL